MPDAIAENMPSQLPNAPGIETVLLAAEKATVAPPIAGATNGLKMYEPALNICFY